MLSARAAERPEGSYTVQLLDDLTTGVTTGKLWTYAGMIMGIVGLESVFLYVMRQVLIGISREIEFELRAET